MPAEAEGTSRASAKAFVRHWIDTLNYAGPAGETEELRALSAPECSACTGIADFVDQVAAAGGDIKGLGWEVEKVQIVSARPKGDFVIDVVTLVHPQTIRPSPSASTEKFKGGKRLKTFTLSSQSGTWRVSRLDQPS
jgi:hypothetical protein